jgi:hypothetical protein
MSRILSRRRFGPTVRPSRTRPDTPVVAHRRLPTHGFGEATLVWSCLDCPAWGRLDPLPPRCPDCAGETVAVVED